MALSYTGKLFRRIAICCGAWTDHPHKITETHFQVKYCEYDSDDDFLYLRGENGKWTVKRWPADDKEYEYWKALCWLRDNGYITVTKERLASYNCYGHVSFIYNDNVIRMTDKGLAAAPAYMRQKED